MIRLRPETLAEAARRAASDADREHRLRAILDAFGARDGARDRQSAMVAKEPALLGDARADAFLARVGEQLARCWRLPMPGWVHAGRRYLTAA